MHKLSRRRGRITVTSTDLVDHDEIQTPISMDDNCDATEDLTQREGRAKRRRPLPQSEGRYTYF